MTLPLLAEQWSYIPAVVVLAAMFYAMAASACLFPGFRTRAASMFLPVSEGGREYFPQLDAFRGFAALSVAVFHIPQWLSRKSLTLPLSVQGFKGVAVFGVLSGFVVYRSYRAYVAAGGNGLRTYAFRRFFRIYPAYAAFLVAVLTAGYVSTQGMTLDKVIADFLMMRVFGYGTYINPVAWSLYAEVLFYLMLPLWVACSGRHRITYAVTTLVLFSVFGGEPSYVEREVYLMRYFFIGIVLSELFDRFPRVARRWGHAALAAGIGLLYLDIGLGYDLFKRFVTAAAGFVWDIPLYVKEDTRLYNVTSVTLGVGIALVIYASLTIDWLKQLLSYAPFRFLGTISYSIYIWHGFVVITAGNVIFDGMSTLSGTAVIAPDSGRETLLLLYLPATITAAILSYLLIERPGIRLGRRIAASGQAESPSDATSLAREVPS